MEKILLGGYMSKNRYAVVLCSSEVYWVGANAILNGLDYYKIKDIDVHFGSHPNFNVYMDYIKDKFSYPLYTYSVPEVCEREDTLWRDHDFCWAPYGIGMKIKDDYEAILFIDARCMIINDISQYFTIAGKTGYILVPIWDIGPTDIRSVPDKFLDNYCREMPWLPYLFFMDCRKHGDLLAHMWSSNSKITDRPYIEQSPPPVDIWREAHFIKGTKLLNKLDDILFLPNSLWTSTGKHWIHDLTPTEVISKGLLTTYNDRINILRGRFWGKAWEPETNQRDTPAMRRNSVLITAIERFLNYNWKVKLNAVELLTIQNHNTLEKF